MDLLFFVLLVAAGLFFYVKKSRGKPVLVDENSFSQEGVTVNFTSGTITIQGRQFSVNQITGISVERNNARGEKFLQTGTVNIAIDDFNNPVHKVTFLGLGAFTRADEFVQRLSLALRKANGPSFN